MKYTIPLDPSTDEERHDFIIATDDDGVDWWVPTDEANPRYQAYLAWVEENK